MCASGSELYDPSWHAWVVIGDPGGRHSAGKIFGIDLDAVAGEGPLRPMGPGAAAGGSAIIKDLFRL
jgi:hypothetical protein